TRSDRDWSSDVCSSDLQSAAILSHCWHSSHVELRLFLSSDAPSFLLHAIQTPVPAQEQLPADEYRRRVDPVVELVRGQHLQLVRSEERRVGKESRCRCA